VRVYSCATACASAAALGGGRLFERRARASTRHLRARITAVTVAKKEQARGRARESLARARRAAPQLKGVSVMKRLAIALMLVVAVMLTDAVAAQGQTERTRVTFTLTSDTCSKLPPGTTIKASGVRLRSRPLLPTRAASRRSSTTPEQEARRGTRGRGATRSITSTPSPCRTPPPTPLNTPARCSTSSTSCAVDGQRWPTALWPCTQPISLSATPISRCTRSATRSASGGNASLRSPLTPQTAT
jgi:hypothetical protein